MRPSFLVKGGVRVRASCVLSLLALGLTSGGCTLLFDGDEYLANGPSRPGLSITQSPTTLDPIAVLVVEPSVDESGAEVTYEYVWTEDSAPAEDVTGDTVPPERTEKGETWSVTVTPIAGGRRGTPAALSTTVVNSPPIVHSVGLSTYHPRPFDTLRALPGGAYDPDGDPFTWQFTWSRNGTVIPTATTQAIVLEARGFVGGDTATVEVVARDTESSPPVSRTVSIEPAATVWRQLLPSRRIDNEHFHFLVHDVANGRVIWQYGEQTWEYYLGASTVAPRWVRLHPTGTPPDLFLHGAVYDPIHERILVIGGIGNGGLVVDTVYALDLTRGAEAWSTIPVGIDGSAPDALIFTSYLYDARRERILAYGTIPLEEETPASDKLWSLDLRPGMEAWSEVDFGGAEPGLLAGVSWFMDERNDVAYMAGGLTFVEGSSEPIGEGDVMYRLRLTPGEEEFEALAEEIPGGNGVVGAATAFDPIARVAYFVHGAPSSNVDEYTDRVLSFDVDSRTFTEITTPGGPPPTIFGSASWDPAGERILALSGMREGERLASIAALGADGSWTPLDVPWVTGPGGVSEPGSTTGYYDGSEGLIVIGGREGHFDDIVARGEIFHYAFETDEWRPLPVASDGGESPPAAWGFGAYSSNINPSGGERYFLGGWTETGPVSPLEAWRLEYDNGTESWSWTRHELANDADAQRPTQRVGAVVVGPFCGNDFISVFGGFDEDGGVVLTDILHYLTACDSNLQSCDWVLGVDTDGPSGGRGYAATVEFGGIPIFFGGLDTNEDTTNDLWAVESCPSDGSSAMWAQVTTAGTPPAPRYGHTMTHGRDVAGGDGGQVLYVFGGSSDYLGGAVPLNDTYVLDPDGWAWSQIDPSVDAAHPLPPPRFHHVSAWDEENDRLLVFGGIAENQSHSNDLWELRVVP